MSHHFPRWVCHGEDPLEAKLAHAKYAESLVDYMGEMVISQSLSECNSTSISMPCFPTTLRSHSLPSGLNEVSVGPVASCDQNDLMWVQPGDINGLKGQLVKLLELSGGCLSLTRVHAEYQKIFGRPLYISEYGEVKLVNLLKKVTPWFW
ncbi:unnamed protein product [Ilex paraguariensis]|uniref:HTH OST-type domain-containing protein n=1 Tax=Ilex paraguariensis TaxID=185542 RepID=A0ABC8RIB8_9AQUA